MQFVSATVLLAVLISGIKTEAEPLTGSLGGPIPGSGAYKDASVTHDYIQAFHHGGQHHGGVGSNGAGGGISEGSSSANGLGHSILSSQIQDQSGLGVVSQDQVSHGSAVPPHLVGPIVAGSSVIPPYFPQKSDVSALHYGARAIGSPFPYYPYYGKTYASPYYSQYQPQPTPYQGVYQPQSFYPYQYSASPYSATGGAAGAAVPYSATPYSSPVTPYSAYPYNYPYIPQYYPGYPSAASGSYYQSSAAEIQSASKQ